MKHTVSLFVPTIIVMIMYICSSLAADDKLAEFNLQKTGGSGGNISSLKVDVIKRTTSERENPCSSVWSLLVENASGERSLVIGFVHYAHGGRQMAGKSDEQIRDEISKAMLTDKEINGAELKHFTVSPWPAMSRGRSGTGRSITRYFGGWDKYICSGKPTKTQSLIIAWRMELWQAGKVVAQFSEPAQQFLKIKNIPDQWWMPNKYPGQIGGPSEP